MQNNLNRTILATALVMGDTKRVIPVDGIKCRLTPYKTVRKMKIEVEQNGTYVYAGKLCLGNLTRKAYANCSFTNLISDEEFIFLVGSNTIEANVGRGFGNVSINVDQHDDMRRRFNELEIQKRIDWIEECDCSDEEKKAITDFVVATLQDCYKIPTFHKIYVNTNKKLFFNALQHRVANKTRKYPKYITTGMQMFLSK